MPHQEKTEVLMKPQEGQTVKKLQVLTYCGFIFHIIVNDSNNSEQATQQVGKNLIQLQNQMACRELYEIFQNDKTYEYNLFPPHFNLIPLIRQDGGQEIPLSLF